MPGWTRRNACQSVVGPWQYQSEVRLGRYTVCTPPGTHPCTPPRVLPTAPPHREQAVRRPCGSAYRQFEVDQGDPRGARTPRARSGLCHPWCHLTPTALRPAPWRLLPLSISNSQYFSVFLSILSAVSLSILSAVSLSILSAVSLRISVYLSYISVILRDPLLAPVGSMPRLGPAAGSMRSRSTMLSCGGIDPCGSCDRTPRDP